MIGKTVLHYKIIEKIGSGGMGVVYKAEDTKLHRTVALKFLPPELTRDEDAKHRFIHEAQAASQFDHHNICTIYDIIEIEDNQTCIVMPCYEGMTLKEKIANGELKIEEVIDIAKQIAEGLKKAHEHGIIHRDIKSANIFITKDSIVKILDFGLAKLSNRTQMTRMGDTVGTVSYMSPEQARGMKVDHRTDIWSFGVVMYEMLTGELPFKSEYEQAVIYSILNEEPKSLHTIRNDIYSEVEQIVERSIKKNPDERYQTINDMVIDLRTIKKEEDRVAQLNPTIDRTKTLKKSNQNSFKLFLKNKKRLLAIIVLLLVCSGIVFLVIPRAPQLNPEMKSRTLTVPFRDVNYANLSKDGNWFIFPAKVDEGKYGIYIMNTSQGQPRKVTSDSSEIRKAMLSPDASTILYTRRNTTKDIDEIVNVSTSGGPGRVILENAELQDWRTDGQRILYSEENKILNNQRVLKCWSAKTDGSEHYFEFSDTSKYNLILRYSFKYSPDGKSIAWIKTFSERYSEIMIYDLEKKTSRQLTFDKKIADAPIWSPTGHILYSSNRNGNVNLWVISSSGGEPIQLTRGAGNDYMNGISSDGNRFLYSESQPVNGDIFIGNLSSGNAKQLTFGDRQYAFPEISPNGKQIVFVSKELDDLVGIRNIYVMDSDGMNVRKLTFDEYFSIYPSWSPDGKWIIYMANSLSQSLDSSRIYIAEAEKPGSSKLIGSGSWPDWITEKEFTFWKSQIKYIGSINSKEVQRFSEDSVTAYPVLNAKYVVINDYRTTRNGLWITSMNSYKLSGTKEARQIFKGTVDGLWFTNKEVYYRHHDSPPAEFHRISLPEGRDIPVSIKFPGLDSRFTLSGDGKTIIYSQFYSTTKFIVINNLFK
ncbi:MAG: protein kinase [Ignavibacteriales bacterium]|nr:protein kinase [Ignavibacteriales bacterium]